MPPLKPTSIALVSISSTPILRLPQSRILARFQCIHSSSRSHANPLPNTVAGPPPAAPIPSPTLSSEKLQRKRRQSELIKRGQDLRAANDPSKPNSTLRKRFWKDVSVRTSDDGDFTVYLDARPLRTSSQKSIFTIPKSKPHLATAIALEWDLLTSASQALKTHLIPLTSIVNRALDISAQDAGEADGKAREEIVEMCMRYLDTDTLLCWAPKPSSLEAEADTESLRSLQIKTSQKITSYLTTKIFPGVEILPILSEDSIIPISQPQTTKDIIRGWITGLPAFELAGLERAVLASKSLCIGIRLIFGWSEHFQKPLDEENKRREESKETEAREERGEEPFGIEEAAQASSLEVAWQTGMWGEVEDTHDVDKEDLKRQFGTVILMVSGRGGP